MNSSKPKFIATAILAVYNSAATVERALTSLLSQSEPIEIIVVDDGSTDNTQSITAQTIKLFPQAQVKIITQAHQGPAIARNLGSRHATTDILLFVDADMVFDRHYVRKLIAPITQGQVLGTYTIDERVGNWDNTLARCWNYQEGWAARKRFPANPPLAGTDYRAILKRDFERVGGFDNIGYTDTWTLFRKLGVRPLATRAICYHKNPDNYRSVFRQAKWAAKRPYKYGWLGAVYAWFRTSLPVSLVAGLLGAWRHREPQFLPFKLVYDLGRWLGILELYLTNHLAK